MNLYRLYRRLVSMLFMMCLATGLCAQTVIINEFLASNAETNVDEDGVASGWIELHNPGSEVVNLNGFTITDNASLPAQWMFPSVAIEPGEFLLVWASENNRTGVQLHANFGLPTYGGFLGLYTSDGTLVDSLTFGEQTTDVSMARIPDGGGGFESTTSPTPGASNQGSGRVAADSDPQVVNDDGFAIVATSANQYALRFDGVNDVVEIPDNGLLSGGSGKSLTLEVWVNLESVSGHHPIVTKYQDGTWKDWGIEVAGGKIVVDIENNGDNWAYIIGAVSPGVWTHLAFTFDNGANTVRIYKNGVQVGSGATQLKAMPDTRGTLTFGRHYGNFVMPGTIDEVRVWNYPRSASQITATMKTQLTGNEAGLIGYWSFNEGSGQSVGDRTGKGSNGRLGNTSSGDGADPVWVTSTVPFGSPSSTLTLTSPNGGESWQVGSNHAITWNSQGSIANVELKYSVNNGTDWTTIVGSTSNDGNYNWTIPNAVSNQSLVRICDAADGNPEDVSNAVFSIGGSNTSGLTPRHDTFVKSSSATTNYGTGTTMRQRKTSTETIASYLKFEVSGLIRSAQSAKLRLFVTDASNDGGGVYLVSNNYQGTSTAWTQTSLNWNNAPAISGTPLSSVGAVTAGSWVEFNVTGAITGNGTYSFGLKNNSSNVVQYNTKEATNKPELVIQASSGALVSHGNPEITVNLAPLPDDFDLYQNYPNPFNPETRIDFDLPQTESVRLIIYNVLGREVTRLVDEEKPAGRHSMVWNGRDENGVKVSSGIYFYSLQAGEFRASRKMLLLQ